MFNYRLDDPLNARMYFDDAPVGVLNSPQIHRPRRGTIGRYVNILLDEWFKKILGASKNKDILLKILQELIPERALFYSTFPLQEQVLARGKDADKEPESHDLHFDYPPVYVVSFLNFSFHPFSERIVYRYDLRERESGELMTDRVNFIFLEMTNYKRGYMEPHPEDSFAEKLSWAFTHMSSLTERPVALMEEVFAKIFEACEVRALDAEERKEYRKDMTTQWDIDDIANTRYWEGKAEGEAEGGASRAANIAANLVKAQKLTPEEISAATGLSLEEIAAL